MTEEKLESTMKEYLESARQAGKSENSGLVAAIFKSIQDMNDDNHRSQRIVYIVLIAILLVIYMTSFLYVITTQVTQDNLDEAVAQSMREYLDINNAYEEN